MGSSMSAIYDQMDQDEHKSRLAKSLRKIESFEASEYLELTNEIAKQFTYVNAQFSGDRGQIRAMDKLSELLHQLYVK